MKARPCLPEDIVDINRRKEYTLISTDLLESVLTDARLNAQTAKLWQILFNKARYNPNLEIKISYSFLGKALGKSTRTIARYVDLLQQLGYLVVTHNFDKNGSQRPSTISVRVPEFSIEHAEKRKDRPTNNQLGSHETLIKKSKCRSPKNQIQDTSLIDPPVSVTAKELEDGAAIVLRETLINSHDDNVLEEASCVNGNDAIETVIDTIEETIILDENIPESSVIRQDKNDRGGYDINVIQKDIDLKEINKNNNNVVVSNEIKSTASELNVIQEKINLLEKQLAEGTKELDNIKDHQRLYDKIRKNASLEGALHLARIAYERLKKDIQIYQNENDAKNRITSRSSLMLDKEGHRPVSPLTFKRLVNSLKGYGYHGDTLNCLINEIVFEIRFGSLINCNKTKKPLSLENAVNIGLKLVREKRWVTPTLFKKFVMDSCDIKQIRQV